MDNWIGPTVKQLWNYAMKVVHIFFGFNINTTSFCLCESSLHLLLLYSSTTELTIQTESGRETRIFGRLESGKLASLNSLNVNCAVAAAATSKRTKMAGTLFRRVSCSNATKATNWLFLPRKFEAGERWNERSLARSGGIRLHAFSKKCQVCFFAFFPFKNDNLFNLKEPEGPYAWTKFAIFSHL